MTATPYHTEASLVIALQQHNDEAFTHLYHHYKGALLTVIKQIIIDDETAENVLQEAIVMVWKNIGQYDSSKGKLFTWLYNVTRNCAINTTRSKLYKAQQKNDYVEDYVNYIDNNTKGVEQNIEQIGLRKQVNLLKTEYKNVIELAYFYGHSHSEIAKILSIPEGTVKTRLRNGLIALRKYFV